MPVKKVQKELLWSAGIAVASILVLVLALGPDQITKGEIDIPLHDTYFVLPTITLFLSLFFGLSYFTSVGRVFFQKSENNLPLLVLVISNVCLLISVIILGFIIGELHSSYELTNQGWTVNPPLSDVPDQEGINISNPLDTWKMITWLVAFLLTGSLAVFSIKYRKAISTKGD